MNPLDLLKVKFQVSTRGPEGGIGRGIWLALRDIRSSEGWRGLYRGLGPNVAGNASSWGLYFFLCVAPFFFPLSPRRRANSEQLCLLFIATTNSNGARPSTRPTGPSRPPNICCILPKRVAQSFLSFFRTPEPLPLLVDSFFFFLLFVCLSRRRDGHPDQSDMGSQSPHVHRGTQLARRAQGALECVRLLCLGALVLPLQSLS